MNKKVFLLARRNIVSLIAVLAFCRLPAQTLDSIAHHVLGYYGPYGGGQWENVLHLRDGSILFVHKEGINMQTTADVVGHEYYKVSRRGAVILDTLFVYDDDPPFFLFAKNPYGDDHLRIGIVRDSTMGCSFLQIFPFDNDLCFDSINEVFVLLADDVVIDPWKSCLINKENDLVFNYITACGDNDYNLHFACFGLDGTLKHENVLPYSPFSLRSIEGLGVFNESPREYYRWGLKAPAQGMKDQIYCYIFDSLFQHKETFTLKEASLSPETPQLMYNFGWQDCLLADGDDFIIGSRYVRGNTNGVCLARYDKQTLEQKDVVLFPSRPMIYSNSMDFGACPIGLGMDTEGSLYFSYNTQQPMLTDKGQIAVAKLDADFNVLWQRFCLEPEGYTRNGSLMTVLDDGGVAVCGAIWYRPEIFMLIVSDDTWDLPEAEAFVRPYAYWPNPAQDELHLQYSPDVTPTQIELHDLQGRLVRSQRNGLESLNLQGLSSGTYTMRVTLAGGKVFSDMVVKE